MILCLKNQLSPKDAIFNTLYIHKCKNINIYFKFKDIINKTWRTAMTKFCPLFQTIWTKFVVCNSWYTKLLEHYEGNFHFKTLNKSNISYWNVKLNMKHIYTRLIDKDWFIVCDFLSNFITFKTERQTDLSNRKTD